MDKRSTLISVIIPAYNYAAFLPETIACLQAQTHQEWECIVVDDESKDDTKEVIQQLMKTDARIQYFFQKNAGPTVARNLGLSKAKGDFIQFLDADDLLENKKFEVQLGLFAKDASLDVVYGNVKYFRSGNFAQQFENMSLEGSIPWMKKLNGRGEEMIKAFLRENLMVIQSPLFKKELINKFGPMNEKLSYNEDWELWTRFAIGNAKFLFDESPGTNSLVRVHKSYSSDNYNMFTHGLVVCQMLHEKLTERKYRKILVPKMAYHMRIIDEKILAVAKQNKEDAMIRSVGVYALTGIGRYKMYTRLYMFFPVWFSYLYSKFLAVFHKVKNTIIYA